MKTLFALVLPLALLGGACGDDDDDAAMPVAQDAGAEDASGDAAGGDDSDGAGERGAATPGASGTATLTLANGEEFEFSIRCNLEPQEAAGQEILFTITSYDEPYGFDATQYGEEAMMPGLASIDVYDSETYEAVWQATSMLDDTELSLDGSTVTGSGTFYEGDEGLGDGIEGELHATC